MEHLDGLIHFYDFSFNIISDVDLSVAMKLIARELIASTSSPIQVMPIPTVLGVRYHVPRYIWVFICQDCSGTYLMWLPNIGYLPELFCLGTWVPRYICHVVW